MTPTGTTAGRGTRMMMATVTERVRPGRSGTEQARGPGHWQRRGRAAEVPPAHTPGAGAQAGPGAAGYEIRVPDAAAGRRTRARRAVGHLAIGGIRDLPNSIAVAEP